jgi:hypothetical protein
MVDDGDMNATRTTIRRATAMFSAQSASENIFVCAKHDNWDIAMQTRNPSFGIWSLHSMAWSAKHNRFVPCEACQAINAASESTF